MKTITKVLVATMIMLTTHLGMAQTACGTDVINPAPTAGPGTITIPGGASGYMGQVFSSSVGVITAVTFEFTAGQTAGDYQLEFFEDPGTLALATETPDFAQVFSVPAVPSGATQITIDLSATPIIPGPGDFAIGVGNIAGSPNKFLRGDNTNPDPNSNYRNNNINSAAIDMFIGLDVIVVDEITNLQNPMVTVGSAQFTWDDQDDEINYDWILTADEAGVGSPLQSNTIAANQNSTSITNLMSNTAYDFYVRSTVVCSGETITSEYVKIDFRTNGDYTYNNGWVDDPNGLDIGNQLITVVAGTAPITANVTTTGQVDIQAGTSLNLDGADITAQLISLGDAASVIGSGYILSNNPTGGTTSGILITGDASINNIRVSDPDGLELASANFISPTVDPMLSLTITGNLDLINPIVDVNIGPPFYSFGEIVLASSASGTANITGTSTLTTTANITAQRYISGNRAVRFLASPVSGQSIFDSWQEGGLEPAGFGTHITGVMSANVTNNMASDAGETDGATGLDITASGNPSMFSYGGAAWSPIANTIGTNHTIGTGYRIFVRGDRNVDLNDNASGPGVTTTLQATGALELGDRSIPTVAGFNLIGNPYQSFVNMDNVSTSNTTGFIYYWDPTLGSQGAYTTVTLPGGAATAGSAASNIVEPGQAFFMESTAAGTIDFERVDAISDTDAAIFSAPQASNSIVLNLFDSARYAAGQTAQDGLIIEFGANENSGIDTRDASKFNNIDENLSIAHSATGTQLAYERTTVPTANDVIQLNLDGHTVANYTFEATVNGLPGLDVFLKDNLTGALTPLSQGTTTVDVTVDVNDANSTALDRFQIVFQNVTLSNGDELSLENAVKVYPNPVNGDEVTVLLGNYSGNEVSYALYNSLGQTIVENNDVEVAAGKISVKNLANLSKGVYLLNITAGAEQVTRRIVIE